MDRRSALVMLAVLGAGVFLSGLELMITAVALPSILSDLADWTQLRHASWIVNGYLFVYVVTMPLAGRLADLWGVRSMFLVGLIAFTAGSFLAGRAQSLDELIVARLVQALGGGILVPVGTAAASHLFEGHARARALGVIGALTFLGMAAGPFVGAAVLESIHPQAAISNIGMGETWVADWFGEPWRWVFYINVPIGLIAIALAWAASAGWETPRRPGRVDLIGAGLFSLGLAALLGGLTLIDGNLTNRLLDPTYPPGPLLLLAAICIALTIFVGVRRPDPFLDPRLFRSGVFSSAALVSLLTGYALATAIVGGAVFVDRVLYGGPDQQRVALGALAGATAVGALVSGFVVRVLPLRWVTLIGLGLSIGGLWRMSTWTTATPITEIAIALAVFGLGFGLTVTPRSTAAVEAVGRAHFGMASATVTVARMIGMAVGLAILVAYGSTVIESRSAAVYATPDAYKQFIPENLRDRPLRDGQVVDALEAWAAGEAQEIIGGLFLVAAGLMVVAVPPALALGGRPAHAPVPGRADRGVATSTPATGRRVDADEPEATLAL
jgi:MFS family permease